MKLKTLTQENDAVVEAPTGLDMLFPMYGTVAPDVPVFDSEKHMYIVDQWTAASGNRYVTYVAVGRRVAAEVMLGFYHGWVLMDKVSLLVPRGTRFDVVKTFEWSGTAYYDLTELRDRIASLATEYAVDNIGVLGGKVSGEVSRFVGELVADLLSQDVDSQLEDNGLQILKAYCRQKNLCKDFTRLP